MITRYHLPKYFDLETDPIHDRIRRDYNGEMLVRFGGGSLLGESYHPVGVSALWSLVGTVASLGETFTFEVRLGMRGHGFYGGFADGKFCLFECAGNAMDILTRAPVHLSGSRRVLLKDRSHQIELWIPAAAMISFDEMLAVGNAVLLSPTECVRTPAFQMFANWDGDVYRDSPK